MKARSCVQNVTSTKYHYTALDIDKKAIIKIADTTSVEYDSTKYLA